jgi:hypothetical protein
MEEIRHAEKDAGRREDEPDRASGIPNAYPELLDSRINADASDEKHARNSEFDHPDSWSSPASASILQAPNGAALSLLHARSVP